MRKGMILAGMLLLVAFPGGRADEAKTEIQPPDPDLKKLQGKWEITYHETAGMEDTEDNRWIMEVRGDKYTLTVGKQTLKGTVKIDSTRSPKLVEYATEEDDGVQEYAGIYELTGDTYKTCDVMKGKRRPTEFKTNDPTGQVAMWKRVKVKD